MDENPTVVIRRQWQSWMKGEVKLNQLRNLHWSDVSGGIFKRAPHFFIHGYVWCDEVTGMIEHSCEHGPGPHSVKVCVVRKDNSKAVYDLLMTEVGPKPERQPKTQGRK